MTKRALPYAIAALVVLLSAAWLLWIGREPICKCGFVKLWHGEVVSAENSQHLSDWYTPSHIIHGFLFYWLAVLALPRWSFGGRLAVAVVVEAIWELIENSDAVIERYRTVTISLDYYGDSVINTVADILAMVAGFYLTARLPVWATVALALAFEVGTALIIRDGLVLNVLMLLWPVEAVAEWQAGR